MKRSMIVTVAVPIALVAALAPVRVLAAVFTGDPSGQGSRHGLDPTVLAGIAVMLVVAKLGGEVFERLGQPAVLGELIGGIIIGNLALVGFHKAEVLKTDEVIAALAQNRGDPLVV